MRRPGLDISQHLVDEVQNQEREENRSDYEQNKLGGVPIPTPAKVRFQATLEFGAIEFPRPREVSPQAPGGNPEGDQHPEDEEPQRVRLDWLSPPWMPHNGSAHNLQTSPA